MDATTITTPVGPLTVIATDTAAVLAAGFTADVAAVLATLPPAARGVPRHRPDLGAITKAVHAYVDGDLPRLDEVEVATLPPGSGTFLAAAWHELRRIPAGQVITYTELAARAGRPRAIRAAASACARNPAALFVPCHRVWRTGGGFGGYRWGVAVKERLLAHERSLPAR